MSPSLFKQPRVSFLYLLLSVITKANRELIALKWGTHTALQLSADEVLALADLLGFDVDHASRKSIDSLYAEQPQTLLKFTYGMFTVILACVG